MLTLCEKDEQTLQRFRAHLLTLFPKEKADQFLTHIRDVLEERNMTGLSDLVGKADPLTQIDTIYKLINQYEGDKEYALELYADFLWADEEEDIDPANQTFISQHFDGLLPTRLESILRESRYLRSLDGRRCYDGDVPYAGLGQRRHYKIVFRLRKNKKSDWLEETLAFIEKNLAEEYRDELKELHHLIADALAADGLETRAVRAIQARLRRLLFIIRWGYRPGDSIEPEKYDEIVEAQDSGVCWKARGLDAELAAEKDPLVEAIQGEYIDREQEDGSEGTIVLYLANILDFAAEHGFERVSCVETAFAHQYFILHYFTCFRAKMLARGEKRFPMGFDEFFPGKIVRESLASYFTAQYRSHDEGYNYWGGLLSGFVTIDFVEESWAGKSVGHYPEAGAAKISDFKHFEEILDIALSGKDGLYRAAYELLK